jgi:serine/threonine protein phosphatase PrpC
MAGQERNMTTPNPTKGGQDPDKDPTNVYPALAPNSTAKVRFTFGAKTHIGKVRPNNEDQYLIVHLAKALTILDTSLPVDQRVHLPDYEGHLLLVADGMGGHAGGEYASALVVNEALKYVVETAKWFFRLDDPDENVRLRLLSEALERIDRQLIEEAKRDPTLLGMGTTLTAVSLLDSAAFIVHVGDSRAYLLRGGRLQQLTRDHTHAQAMVEQGRLRPEEVRTHHLRHLLSNTLGGLPGVEGEVLKFPLTDGDRLLLCTDGLTELVRDDEITTILLKHPDAKDACGALIEAALDHGGPDNITAVMANCSIGAVSATINP